MDIDAPKKVSTFHLPSFGVRLWNAVSFYRYNLMYKYVVHLKLHFASKSEKHSFELLLGVSGVGPKAALSILSSSNPEALAMAVVAGDDKALTAAPGVGKKLAQRIILELKDKLAKEADGLPVKGQAPAAGQGGGSKLGDAVAALTVLGYGSAEISAAIKQIDVDALGLEDIIRQALKLMLRQ